MKSTNYNKIALAIQSTEQGELCRALGAHGGTYEFESDKEPGQPVVEFYNGITGPASGIVSCAWIENFSKDTLPEKPKIFLTVTDRDNLTYNINADDVYPCGLSVVTEFLPEPEKKLSVSEKLQTALSLLSSLRDSGYWPYASPAPCSTELAIKKNLDAAIERLEAAMAFHDTMFERCKRDPMKAPSSVIREH